MFRNTLKTAQQFISLARSSNQDETLELIKECPEMVSTLFKNAEEIIQLARSSYKPIPNVDVEYKLGGEIAYQLISKQSEKIAGLFKNPEQLIQLAQVDSSPALALVNLQSKTISDLFKHSSEFIRLASATDINIPCALIRHEPRIIFSLFKSEKDIQHLVQANSQVADVFTVTATYHNTTGLLKDLFPAAITNYLKRITHFCKSDVRLTQAIKSPAFRPK